MVSLYENGHMKTAQRDIQGECHELREWNYTATSQGMPGTIRSWKRQGKDFGESKDLPTP